MSGLESCVRLHRKVRGGGAGGGGGDGDTCAKTVTTSL